MAAAAVVAATGELVTLIPSLFFEREWRVSHQRRDRQRERRSGGFSFVVAVASLFKEPKIIPITIIVMQIVIQYMDHRLPSAILFPPIYTPIPSGRHRDSGLTSNGACRRVERASHLATLPFVFYFIFQPIAWLAMEVLVHLMVYLKSLFSLFQLN